MIKLKLWGIVVEYLLNKLKEAFSEEKKIVMLMLLLLITDYIVILGAEAFAYWIRKDIIPVWYGVFEIRNMVFYFIIPGIILVFLNFNSTYNYRMQFWQQSERIFQSICYAMLMIIMLLYFGGVSGGISRIFIFLFWLLALSSIVASRYIANGFLRKSGIIAFPVLFIGAGKTADLVLKAFELDGGFCYKIKGFLDDHPASNQITKKYPILGRFDDIEEVVERFKIQHVIITAPGLEKDKLLKIINKVQLKVKNVTFVPDLIGVSVGNLSVESLFNEKVVMLRVQNNLAKLYNRNLKRLFDVVFSFIGVVMLSPIFIVICICIYIASPGPVVFSHYRIGKNGKSFPCYKFRTMIMNSKEVLEEYLEKNPEAKKEWNENFKLKDDPRVTKIGSFLRKTSLDELPQLFNVLKGEMSLVGPRPIVKDEIVKYKEFIDDYYLVLPGITGMWQVNGRSDTTYDERVAMDSWYVRNWSVWIDIVFLVKTVVVVLKKDGAY